MRARRCSSGTALFSPSLQPLFGVGSAAGPVDQAQVLGGDPGRADLDHRPRCPRVSFCTRLRLPTIRAGRGSGHRGYATRLETRSQLAGGTDRVGLGIPGRKVHDVLPRFAGTNVVRPTAERRAELRRRPARARCPVSQCGRAGGVAGRQSDV